MSRRTNFVAELKNGRRSDKVSFILWTIIPAIWPWNLALVYHFETIKSKKLQLALMTLASFYTLALQTKEMFWQPNVCGTKKPFQAVSHQQKLPTWQQGLLPATALSLLLTIGAIARSALWRRLPSRALALGTCYYSCSCRGFSRWGFSISAFGVDSWGTTYVHAREAFCMGTLNLNTAKWSL